MSKTTKKQTKIRRLHNKYPISWKNKDIGIGQFLHKPIRSKKEIKRILHIKLANTPCIQLKIWK